MSEPETARPHLKAGAGVIPFSTAHGKVQFLLQTVFSGRKTGYLNDFGGGLGKGEDYRAAAIREFVEETETMYFADDVAHAWRSRERIESQLPRVAERCGIRMASRSKWYSGDRTRK